jgi:MoaA/NifB/PqqE/SkfB family radical SAM enzyme
MKLLEFGNQNNIYCGVTTNGSCLNPETARKVVAAKPFNINVSVDAPNAKLHDHLRGQPGLFEKLSQGIQYLVKEQNQQGIKFPIIIKPTINKLNFKLMPELVTWAEIIGATAINIQPVNRWTSETYEELWIEKEDLREFEAALQTLIQMQRSGAPIMNSEYVLNLLPSHFKEESAPPDSRPCRVGLRNFLIDTVGDVKMCNDYPVIGNIKRQKARDIWYSEKAKKIRDQTLKCNKLCVSTVTSHKSFKDKTRMALQLLN